MLYRLILVNGLLVQRIMRHALPVSDLIKVHKYRPLKLDIY